MTDGRFIVGRRKGMENKAKPRKNRHYHHYPEGNASDYILLSKYLSTGSFAIKEM